MGRFSMLTMVKQGAGYPCGNFTNVLSDECYKQAKDEGCLVEVVWQDGDSSSAKSVVIHHPNGKVFKCGGHVGRAHDNCLKEAAKKRRFPLTLKASTKENFHKC